MSYQEAYQEPYTKYPNRYNDLIKPRLTGTQRDVCDVVIRMTYGWHRESAVISNTMFKTKTGKSEPAIIRAKKSLEEMGVLVVLKKGGGSKTSQYSLDLYYDTKDSIKILPTQQEEERLEIEKEQEDIPEVLENEVIDKSEPELEKDPAYEESILAVELDEEQPPEETPEMDLLVDERVDSGPIEAECSDTPTPNAELVLYKEDLSNNILSKRKQTIDSEDEKAEKKEATAAVCSLLRSWGTELEGKDYAFVGWSLKTYGVEAVQQKIEIMKLQRSRGVTFSNPLGWLRSALSKNYRYSSWDADVTKAKERARRESERSKLEQVQRESEIREAEKLKDEAEKMKTQLAPEDRGNLRKAAIEKISGMGVASNWINEPLIESVENEILREKERRE